MTIEIVSPEAAALIVDAIIADLTGRSGLQNEWEDIDAITQAEIRETWKRIVRTAGTKSWKP